MVVLAATGFAVTGALALLAPRLTSWYRPPLVPLAAALAIAGAWTGPAATGIDVVDALWRGGLCGAAVLLAAGASRPVLVAAAALALAGGATSAAGWPAAVGLGLMAGSVVARVDLPVVKAAAGGLVAVAAFHFSWPTAERATAILAVAISGLIAASGLAQLPGRSRRRLVRAGVAAAGLTGAFASLGLLAAAQARPAVHAGISKATTALRTASGGDGPGAGRQLATAADSFADARRQLDIWWARPALVVPVVARQSAALRAMAASGSDLGRAGARAVGAADTHDLELAGGAVPIGRVAALRGPAREAFSALALAEARLQRVRSPWLLPAVASRLTQLSERVARARGSARVAMVATEVAPGLLGADGPRRYFLAVQTPAESRASGGLIGNFGEIGADKGRLTLDRVGRTADLNTGGDPKARRLVAPPDYTARYARFDIELHWQNITMSPDFPTVARTIARMYPQSGGRPVDGVIAIDPLGLAALLKVLGPIQVAEWPVPLTDANAAEVLLFEQYVRLDKEARVDFLGKVTQAVWQRLTTKTVNVVELARAVGPMVAEKHLQLASTHANEERGFLQLGVAGEMAPVRGDFLGVVTQNAGGSKIDWFLRRSVKYQARFEPSSGEVRSTARIDLRNLAPAGGLPDYVIGSETKPPLPLGTNKVYLSVYTPWLLSGARVDGRPLLLEPEIERDRHVYSTYLTIPAGGSSTVELDLEGRMDPADGYRLDLHRQAFLAPDAVEVSVVKGGSTGLTSRLQLTSDRTVPSRVGQLG